MHSSSSIPGSSPRLNLQTPLVNLLGCEYPILSAGMGGVARYELAAAVSIAGGLGCLGMVRESVPMIQEQVAKLRERTDRPFAVNIIPSATDRKLLKAQIDCLIELRVPMVCLFWKVDSAAMKRLLDAGITVLHQVGSISDTDAALKAGADVIIAQGNEAGGHVRGNIGTLSLLPQIAAISPVPVVAAGGIVSGQGLAAALMLGAQGVCCGSAFLATTESNAHDSHKEKLVFANSEDTVYTHKFHLNWPERAPVRVLRNEVTDTEFADDELQRTRQIGTQDGQPVFLYSTDSPLRGATGELEKMPHYAGQACGQIQNICSAAERLQQLVAEADESFSSFVLADTHEALDEKLESDSAAGLCSPVPSIAESASACSKEELLSLLFLLLRAERAGAKICAYSLKHAGVGRWHRLLLQIHRDVVRSCGSLIESIRILGGEPHRETGDFFDKCMALDDLQERLLLLSRGQEWVVQNINEILPRVAHTKVYRKLCVMRDGHNSNIQCARVILKTG